MSLWELVVLRADEEGNGMADYYCWQDGRAVQLRTSARITSTMAELSQQGRVKSGVLQDGTPALFVTGVEESAWMVTDILTVKNGELVQHPAVRRDRGVLGDRALQFPVPGRISTATASQRCRSPMPIPAWGNGVTDACQRIDWHSL